LGRKYHKNGLREHEYSFADSPKKTKKFLQKKMSYFFVIQKNILDYTTYKQKKSNNFYTRIFSRNFLFLPSFYPACFQSFRFLIFYSLNRWAAAVACAPLTPSG
jgi:hypothetical protein